MKATIITNLNNNSSSNKINLIWMISHMMMVEMDKDFNQLILSIIMNNKNNKIIIINSNREDLIMKILIVAQIILNNNKLIIKIMN